MLRGDEGRASARRACIPVRCTYSELRIGSCSADDGLRHGQTPARSYLARLASPKIDYNPFDASLHKRYWKLPFQVWGDARNKRF